MRVLTIIGGVVASAIALPDDYVVAADHLSASPAGNAEIAFSDPEGGLLVASEEAAIGDSWTIEGGFVAAPIDEAALKTALTSYATDARWRKETGGISIAGVPVATDDRSKQMIIGARIAADADPNWTTQWVGGDGAIYPIDAATIIAISNAVQAHVNACFATYATVKAAIDAGTTTTTTEIDAAFAV